MFFVPAILDKKGPLSIAWLAAHMHKKLTKSQILQADIERIVEMLSGNGDVQLSLRVTCDLLVGICHINKRQIDYALESASRKLKRLQQWITGSVQAKKKKRAQSVDLPEGPQDEVDDWNESFEQIHRLDQLMQQFALEMPPTVELNEDDLFRLRRAVTMDEGIPQLVEDIPIIDFDFGQGPLVDTQEMGFLIPHDDQSLSPPPFVSQNESTPVAALDYDDYPHSTKTKRPRLEFEDFAIPDASPVLPTDAKNQPPQADFLVLPTLTDTQIARNRIRRPAATRRRQADTPLNPKPPASRPHFRFRCQLKLILDEETYIDDDEMRNQLVPPSFDLMPEFAPNHLAFKLAPTGDVSFMFSHPLRSLPTRLQSHFNEAIVAGKHRQPVERVEPSPEAPITTMEVDQSSQLQPPLNFEEDAFFNEDWPVAAPPDATAQPPINDHNDKSPIQQRRKCDNSRVDHLESLENEISQSGFDRTMDETMAKLLKIEEMTFTTLLGRSHDRQTAVRTFLSLLQRADRDEVELRQRASFQQFNPIAVYSTTTSSQEI